MQTGRLGWSFGEEDGRALIRAPFLVQPSPHFVLQARAHQALVGNVLFKNAISRRWPVSHLIGHGLLGSGVLLAEWLDVLGLAAWTVAVLIAVAALERLLLRSHRAAVQGIK